MNDLVTMIQNVKQGSDNLKNVTNSKKNNLKGDGEHIKFTGRGTNTSFKATLNKLAIKNEAHKDEILENKAESISPEDTSKNSKIQKKKLISIDMILILLLQHMGDKVNLEDVLEKLKEENSEGENITGDILKLIGNSEIDGININELNSLKSIEEKIKAIIEALKKASQNDDKLKSMLTKLRDLNNKDIDKHSIEKVFEDVIASSNSQDKNVDIHNQIVDILKSKLLNNKSENNSSESLKTLRTIVETTAESKNIIPNEGSNESKNQSNDKSFEEDFLKDLVSKDKNKSDTKIDRLTNFMADFNKVNNVKQDIEIEAPITINKNNIVNDFIKSIKYMEQNNVKEMTVKVMPRELGEIVIRLTMENGLMKANITASNKEAYNLLNSKAQELNNILGNGEIKIQNFTIDIYNGDTTFFSRENRKEQRNNSSNNTKGKNNSITALEDIKENEEVELDKADSNVNAFV